MKMVVDSLTGSRNLMAFSVTHATISSFFDANKHFWRTLSIIFGLLVKFYFGHSVVSVVVSGLLAKQHFVGGGPTPNKIR